MIENRRADFFIYFRRTRDIIYAQKEFKNGNQKIISISRW